MLPPSWYHLDYVLVCAEMDACKHDQNVWSTADTFQSCVLAFFSRGFLEILDVHYNSLATHALVASDSSLMVMLALTVRNKLHMKQLDVKTIFLNTPLQHEVGVRFPSGHVFALLHRSLYGLKQTSSYWYSQQHVRLMIFYLELLRSITDPCFYYKVRNDECLFFLVYVDDNACAYSNQSYFDAWLRRFGGVLGSGDKLDVKLLGM